MMKLICLLIIMTFNVSLAKAEWPERTIRIIAPIAAGNATDIVVRKLVEKLKDELKVDVYVLNKPGAGGKIGINEAKNSKPDGYNFLWAPSLFISALYFQNDTGYKIEDFIPITNVVNHKFYFAAKKGVTEEQFLSKKEDFFYCSFGIGSVADVATLIYFKKYNIKGTKIAYRASEEGLTHVASKSIDICSLPETLLISYEKDNMINVYRSTVYMNWNAFFAPKGTPKEIVDKFAKAVNKVKLDPEFKKWTNDMKIEIIDNDTPESFYDYLQKYNDEIKSLVTEIKN